MRSEHSRSGDSACEGLEVKRHPPGNRCLHLEQEDQTPVCIRETGAPEDCGQEQGPWPFRGTPGRILADSGLL